MYKIFFAVGCLFVINVCHAQQDDYSTQLKAAQAKDKMMKDGIPLENVSKHAASVAPITTTSLLTLVKALQTSSLAKVDGLLKTKIIAIASRKDSNAAATGMLLYANGLEVNASRYLIGSGIIKNIKDPWAINSLAVLYKNNSDYEHALALFKYAEKLADSTPVIKTNIGWAAAYYGDFVAAKTYFLKALQIDPQHGGAMQGMAMIAYAQGDIKTFFEHLAKQIKGFGGARGEEPSGRFVDYVEDMYLTDPVKRKEDPFTDHAFDNDATDNDPPRGNVGGADQQVDAFPQFNSAFILEPFQLDDNLSDIRLSHQQLNKQSDDASLQLSQMKQGLPPLSLPPYADDHGDIITPRNYENEFKLFHIVEILYQRREANIALQYIKETNQLGKQIDGMGEGIYKELNTKRDPCATSPKSYPLLKTALGMNYTVWQKYHLKSLDNATWFIQATSAYIGKVHEVKLNDYLNARRNFLVKANLITYTYGRWLTCCNFNRGMMDTYHPQKQCVAQWTPMGMMGGGNDGGSIKHFKKWPEKCYVPTGDYDGGAAAIEMTCDHLKVSFGAGAKLNAQIDFKEDESHDETKIWLSAGIDKDKKFKIGEGQNAVDAAKLKVELEGELFIKFKGTKMVDAGIDAKGELSGKLGTKTGIDKIDELLPTITFKESGSISVHTESGIKGSLPTGSIKVSNVPGS